MNSLIGCFLRKWCLEGEIVMNFETKLHCKGLCMKQDKKNMSSLIEETMRRILHIIAMCDCVEYVMQTRSVNLQQC